MPAEQPRIKKVTLDIGFDYDFILLGVVSLEKFHRLVWQINQHSGYNFYHAGELDLYEQEKRIGAFTKYAFNDEINHREILLLENKDESTYLIPEMRTVDYFMLIKGALDNVDVKAFIQNLKPVDNIQLITEIDTQKLKSRQNLIF
jgi:hypothetical protein